jgi:hypothetical protein
MEDLTYQRFVEFNTCELPECANRRLGKHDFCKLHQTEMEDAQKQWAERTDNPGYMPADRYEDLAF